MKRSALFLFVLGSFLPQAKANICGTDYQNFNPTTNGLDFVTVHSSETLKPCIINTGLFFNYAANSLTYSRTLNNNLINGQRRSDRVTGMDLGAGMGLTERWDFGISVPFVLKQVVQDDYYVASYGSTGATEIKANTKYRFIGNEEGGVAGILSINKNLMEDNPFTGRNPGLTWNFELAADTTLGKHWALGVNAGYRKRSPGDPVPNVPFVPLQDQWIYSAAGSYHVERINTKVILELYGSRVAKPVDQDTDRNLNSLEALLGFKHDVTQNFAAHLGMTRQVDTSLGGPEWRAYAGFNWALGPVCKDKPVSVAVAEPASPAAASDAGAGKEPQLSVYKLDVELLFAFNSDKVEESALHTIDSFAKDFSNEKITRILVEGHTDSMGPEEHNMVLSTRRAEFIKKYLIDNHKVPRPKIDAAGYGPTRPIANNGNYQGRRQNRRVEIKVWKYN